MARSNEPEATELSAARAAALVGSELHPFCAICGWRLGGKDSWDGTACKCGIRSQPIKVVIEGAP